MIGAHRNIHAQKLLYEQLESRNQSLEQQIAERTAELVRLNGVLQQKAEENRQLAETDALTGAASRYRLERVIKQECGRSRRFHQSFSVIAMDVDDFKQINDNYGHSAGDQTLVNIVALVRMHIREIDLIARWGGDEFMVVLPNTGLADGRLVADKLRELIVQSRVCEQLDITLSFGLAEYLPNESMSQLMVRVDRALYQAKLAGKNQICE
jgi:diguanylate cyclase (GGDEF)-like protein